MSGSDPKQTIYPVILKVPEEKQALSGREKVRFLSAFARKALRHSARRLGVDLPKPEKSENGAPIPKEGIHWSISHKRLYVAAAAAPQPVGIDIEQIRSVKAGLDEKIADTAEWRLFPGDRRLDFFRCWTAKEAVLKAAGVGIAGLPECRIVSVDGPDRLSAVYRNGNWAVSFRLFDRHLTAVAASGCDLCWTLCEGEDDIPLS